MSEAGLQARIESLESQVRQLLGVVNDLTGPYPRLFPAKQGASAVKWQEQTVNAGALIDYPAGRLCNSDSHASALIEPASDQFFLMEFKDGSGHHRYVKVSGGGGSSILPCTISGAKAGSGWYDGQPYAPPSDTTVFSSPVNLPEGMASSGDPIVILNPAENGEDADLHSLESGVWGGVLMMGTISGGADDGKRMGYWISGNGLPPGGERFDVITKYSDTGAVIWGDPRYK